MPSALTFRKTARDSRWIAYEQSSVAFNAKLYTARQVYRKKNQANLHILWMDLFSSGIKATRNLICTTLPLTELGTLMPGSKTEIESVNLNCFFIIWLVISALFWPVPGSYRGDVKQCQQSHPHRRHSRAAGTARSPAATSSLFSKSENQKLFPFFYFAFKDDRKMINSQSPDTSIC